MQEQTDRVAALSDSVQQVVAFLRQSGVPYTLKTLSDSTRTAQMAAEVLHCTTAEIANSLIFTDTDTGELILIVASGGHRVDVDSVSHQLGRKLHMARGRDIKKRTGFAIGGVPPVAHEEPLLTYLDAALRWFTTVWAAAGSPFAVFGLTPDNLATLTGGTWLAVAADEFHINPQPSD